MDTASLLAELRDAVGPANVLTDGLERYTLDPRGVPGAAPVAVVRPGTTPEVVAVVGACAAAGASVVTQGGHTGMSGGAQVEPTDAAAVVVSLARMNGIERVDEADGTATVEAGVTIEALQKAAEDVGLRFGPDWGARGTATVGGGVATNAGGNNVLHHGPMRDHVLGLEVVLADGRVWDGLRALHKDASGYRLRDLFIGSEGTLGIVTRVVVRLVAPPADERSAFVALRDLDAAPALLDWLRRCGAGISAFELMPEYGVGRAIEQLGRRRPLDTIADWYVLFRISAPRGADITDVAGDALEGAFAAGLVVGAVVAGTTEQEENLWTIRDQLSPSLSIPDARHGAKFDTSVPVGRFVEFVRRAGEIVERVGGDEGWTPYAFGHVGDGNVHFYALAPTQPDPSTRQAIDSAVDALIVEMGGSLSAEHGIGRLLVDRIHTQKSDLEVELAWRLKDAFDPEGLFNPGKTLPERGHRA